MKTHVTWETNLGEGAVLARVAAELELDLLVAVVHLEDPRIGGPGVVAAAGRRRLRQNLEGGDALCSLK
jgi:hypothetical protein